MGLNEPAKHQRNLIKVGPRVARRRYLFMDEEFAIKP